MVIKAVGATLGGIARGLKSSIPLRVPRSLRLNVVIPAKQFKLSTVYIENFYTEIIVLR